ncbi:MAG TPA: bifunctional 3-(3-hydroxy-phenyl)propionate/3-hydroxycinnamic acid hydroxylase [Steroidobacteraceae bacterium]
MSSFEYDVAIVGCGPVGALAGNLLGRAGLSTLVVESELLPHPLPRAVHVDHEMMRLFQAAGVIETIAQGMRDTDGHLHIGADHGVIRYMGTIGRPRPFGWSSDYFFYQPELEARLRAALEAYPQVQLCLGTSFAALSSDGAGVSLSLRSGMREWQTRARWVLACDGASSPVRKALGIELEDLGFDEPWLVIDAEVEGPVRFPELSGVPAGANLQRLSVMMCDPERPATIVPGRGNHRRWEFMLLPQEIEAEAVAPDRVAELIDPWLRGVPHRMVRATTYRFHGLIARQWQAGAVFLAGDAAHQTPPFFGQGMCHGMRDVANLAWKLALVKSGGAPESLLTTYQLERETHVRKIIGAAIDAGRYICVLDRQAASLRDVAMRKKAKLAVPTTAADLIPALADGVILQGSSGAGERFIQPWVTRGSGRALLDEVTGGGWRLFVGTVEAAEDARRELRKYPRLPAISVVPIPQLTDDGALTGWLLRHGAHAVLVRPDFYVFGTLSGSAPVERLLHSLSEALGIWRKP